MHSSHCRWCSGISWLYCRARASNSSCHAKTAWTRNLTVHKRAWSLQPYRLNDYLFETSKAGQWMSRGTRGKILRFTSAWILMAAINLDPLESHWYSAFKLYVDISNLQPASKKRLCRPWVHKLMSLTGLFHGGRYCLQKLRKFPTYWMCSLPMVSTMFVALT